MSTLLSRMWRAAKLEAELYEEVEADEGATWQAAAVVVLSSLAAAAGSSPGLGTAAVSVGGHLLIWAIWAFLTYFVGTRILPDAQTEADWAELLRTIGFASAPGILRVLGVFPILSDPVFWLASLWMLVAMVIAVRQALDYQSTWRAAAVCAVGWLVYLLVLALITTSAS